MKRYDPKTVTRVQVAGDIGYRPGYLSSNGLSPAQRTALKYYSRRWLGLSHAQVQGPIGVMREAYDSADSLKAYDAAIVAGGDMFERGNDAATDEGSDLGAETIEIEAEIETETKAETKGGDDAAQLAALIRSLSAGAMDADAVRKVVNEQFAKLAEKMRPGVATVEVKFPDGKIKEVGRQHKQFPTLLKMVAAGCNVWLAGPAGSGKTTAAEFVAKALDRPFYFNGAIDNEYKLLGFTDAQGRVVSRPFREAFCNGGVYLFDEVDASLPSAVLAFNAALANGKCDFPDGCHDRHPDFVAIAAGNTWGHGATSDYVGRFKMDAAFADRFVMLEWGYDEALERELAGNDEWTSRVQTIRAKTVAMGVKVVVSPRASIYGAKLLAAGLDRETVEAATIRKGMTAEQWRSVAA